MTQNAINPDTPYVLHERDGDIVKLTLNRGEKFNPLSEEMLTVLQTELDAIAKDTTARLVILAANGKAFCAGHDLKQMRASPSAAYYKKLFDQCSKMMLTIQQMPQPVIARVQGIAAAAGCQCQRQPRRSDLALEEPGRARQVAGRAELWAAPNAPQPPATRRRREEHRHMNEYRRWCHAGHSSAKTRGGR